MCSLFVFLSFVSVNFFFYLECLDAIFMVLCSCIGVALLDGLVPSFHLISKLMQGRLKLWFLVTIWIPRGIKISHYHEKHAHTEKSAACISFKENLQ